MTASAEEEDEKMNPLTLIDLLDLCCFCFDVEIDYTSQN